MSTPADANRSMIKMQSDAEARKKKYNQLWQLLDRLDPQWIHTRATPSEQFFLTRCSSCKRIYDPTQPPLRNYRFKERNRSEKLFADTIGICEDCMIRLPPDNVYRGRSNEISLYEDPNLVREFTEYYEESDIARLRGILHRILEDESSIVLNEEEWWKRKFLDYLNDAMEGFGEKYFPAPTIFPFV